MLTVPKQLSVVIPCFNEQERLPAAVKVIKQWLATNPQWEFVLVNDGSTDQTLELMRQLARKHKEVNCLSYTVNQGKGYALKQGVKKAKKPLILICDVDFSTPLSELSLMYPFIKKFDLVIGSRKVEGANIIKHQARWREFLGQQFTNLSKLYLGLKVSDVTCGFKLFRKQAAKQLFQKSRIMGWGYDAEILFLAKKLKLKTAEVAVSWKNDERTKVSLIKDIVRSSKELWLISWHEWQGKYN